MAICGAAAHHGAGAVGVWIQGEWDCPEHPAVAKSRMGRLERAAFLLRNL